MRVTLIGDIPLEAFLQKKQRADFQRVAQKNARDMLRRARLSNRPSRGGTPRDTGALMSSSGLTTDGTSIGYGEYYAPYVEFGHRLKNGKTVPGQYYLRTNLNIQRDLFKEDILEEMRRK